jgi:hypothetical protein
MRNAPDLAGIPASPCGEAFREDIALVGEGHIVCSYGLPAARPTGIMLASPSNNLARTSAIHDLGGIVHGFCVSADTNRLFAADSLAIVVFRLVNGDLAEEARFPLSRNPLYGPRALAIADNGLLLAACGADGLRAYAYDGTNLALRATCETDGFACDVAVSGDRIFVADRERGITVCRFAKGKLEKLRTHALPRGTATALVARDGIAYVAAGTVPLAILADDLRPLPLASRGKAPSGAYALDIALLERGDKLFALVADGRAGLSLFDVTDPRAPAFASLLTADETELSFLHAVDAVCTDGRLVYALDAASGLLFALDPFAAKKPSRPFRNLSSCPVR